MVRKDLFCAVGVLLLLGSSACDKRAGAPITAPSTSGFSIGVPDSSFRLTPAERHSIMEGFDSDAVERLVSMVPPEARATILSRFQHPAPGQPARLLVRLGHPALQAELERVWAPFWSKHSASEMDSEVRYLPGRAEAKRLRQMRDRQVADSVQSSMTPDGAASHDP